MHGFLARLAAYRRTKNLLDSWRPPVGVTLSYVCWPSELRVDVIVSAQGQDELNPNLTLSGEASRDAILGYMAREVMRRAVVAYEAHEVQSDVVFDMTMAQAHRKFEEGVESAMCKGTGRDDG